MRMFVSPIRRLAAVVLLAVLCAIQLSAADQWVEVKSPHFTVLSNAGDRGTRKLAWQLEQIRSALTALFSWAQADLNRPLLAIGLKDESSMRAFAPAYWETRGAVKPATLWASGPDQYYLALRTDVEIDTRLTINPYMAAYASYVSLILRQSSPRDLPLWFSQGFTGVLSNTIVRDDDVLVGAPIPFYLEVLRDRPILPLANASSRPLPATAAGSVAAPAAVSQACRGGDSEACATLLPAADRACGGGNGQACVFVGSLYERGLGVAADPARAAALYRQACDKDDARGCLAGAMLQARGAGVPKDVAAADATLTRLCDAAVMDACTQLAMLVAPGGTPANLARARTLLTKACDARAPRACELLSSLPSR